MSAGYSSEIKVGTVGTGGQVASVINNYKDSPTPDLRLDLHPVKWQVSDTSRFRYTAQGTPVFGRQEEQERLRRFLASDHKPFCWWLIGGSGGMGKSRLAFELALEAKQSGWDAGFLPRGTGARARHTLLQALPDDWPTRPTLLILDYIAGEEEQTGVSVAHLARRKASSPPLRLLLLERDTDPTASWWLRFWGSGEQLSILEESRYDLPLTLAPLPQDVMARIVEEWPRTKPRAAHWHPLQQQIHFGGRPLYAVFLADALETPLTDGREQWNQLALVSMVLQREQDRWRENGVTEQDVHLLLLATLCGGLDTSHQDLPKYVKKLLNLVAQVQKFSFSDRCLTMTGHALDETQPRLFPLEPDLLGELLLLEALCPKPPAAADPRSKVRRKSLATAWVLNPLGVFATLSRTAQDFPTHPGLFPLAKEVPDGLPGRLFWARMVVNVIGHAGGVQTAQAQTLLDLLVALAKDHDQEAPLRKEQAKGAFNLIVYYGKAGQIDEARRLYEAIAALAQKHDQEAPLREAQANGAVNLIPAYGKAGQIGEAGRLYEAIAALAQKHDQEAPLREAQANGAVNLIFTYGNAGQIGEARRLYEAIAALAQKYDQETPLREWQTKGAVNLILAYGNAGQIDEAHGLYEAIAALAQKHDQEAPLREWQAKGAVNLIFAYGNAGQIGEAGRLYEAIAALAQKHDQEAPLRELQAKSAVNLIVAYGKAGQIGEAHRLYEAIAALAQEHDQEAPLREEQANGAVNLIAAYGNAGQIDEARGPYEAIAALADSHPEEPFLRDVALARARQAMPHFRPHPNLGGEDQIPL